MRRHLADGFTMTYFYLESSAVLGTSFEIITQKFFYIRGIATKKAALTENCSPALTFILQSGWVFTSELCELKSRQTKMHLQLISTHKCKTVTYQNFYFNCTFTFLH